MQCHTGHSTSDTFLVVQISAKKGTGVDDLLETVALVAEVEQLMANPVKAAAGTVLEAHLDKRVGAIATLLVQTGTLHVGDVVVAGSAYGKVGFPLVPCCLNVRLPVSLPALPWLPCCLSFCISW